MSPRTWLKDANAALRSTDEKQQTYFEWLTLVAFVNKENYITKLKKECRWHIMEPTN